jgi:hypothetical protein
LGGTFVFEDGGAGVGGGACGEDIIDEEDGSAGGVAGGAPAEVEGGFEIEEPVFAAEGGLGGSVAETAEGVDDGEAGEGAEGVGEFCGLVEFAFAEAARVERDGDKDPVLTGGDARVVEGVEEERGEREAEGDAAAVLEVVDGGADGAAAHEGGDGEGVVLGLAHAVGAGEVVGDGALERFAADGAERAGDW